MGLRTLVDGVCWVLHRTWWIPLWNRSLWLSCPIVASGNGRLARWYWRGELDGGD